MYASSFVANKIESMQARKRQVNIHHELDERLRPFHEIQWLQSASIPHKIIITNSTFFKNDRIEIDTTIKITGYHSCSLQ